jgi:hypothetical protein
VHSKQTDTFKALARASSPNSPRFALSKTWLQDWKRKSPSVVVDPDTTDIKRPDEERFLGEMYCEHGEFSGSSDSVAWISDRVSLSFY